MVRHSINSHTFYSAYSRIPVSLTLCYHFWYHIMVIHTLVLMLMAGRVKKLLRRQERYTFMLYMFLFIMLCHVMSLIASSYIIITDYYVLVVYCIVLVL